MAITFQQTPLRWENAGTEPSKSLKENGYSAGMKPAANTFNYQINNASACLTELQTEVSELDTALNTLNNQAIKGISGNGEIITPDSSKIVHLNAYNIGAAAASHEHSAADITSGTLPVERGGTGATTAAEARKNLDIMHAVCLYENQSGTNGTITLSDDASNYEILDITLKDENYKYSTHRIYDPNGKMCSLCSTASYLGMWFRTSQITISGTSISHDSDWYARTYIRSGAVEITKVQALYIVKIIGYK